MTTTPQRPTAGQRRILQFAARVNRRLCGQRVAVDSEVEYRIVETSSLRVVMQVTRPMVASLLEAGWIAVAPGGNRMDFAFRVTEAGLYVANRPTSAG